MNGASDLMVAVFGDEGRHARTTVGVAALPLDAAVEVEGAVRGRADRHAPVLAMSGLDWLIARPMAHRGLHDAGAGVIENTPSAFAAAIAADYAIEIDVQISPTARPWCIMTTRSAGSPTAAARSRELTAAELKRVPYRATADRMITLGELCDLIGGRATLMVELKSAVRRRPAAAARVAAVLATMQARRPPCRSTRSWSWPCGVSPRACRVASSPNGATTSPNGVPQGWQRLGMAHLLHAPVTRPDFVAYRVDDLPAPATRLAHVGLPVLTWTVRTSRTRSARRVGGPDDFRRISGLALRHDANMRNRNPPELTGPAP